MDDFNVTTVNGVFYSEIMNANSAGALAQRWSALFSSVIALLLSWYNFICSIYPWHSMNLNVHKRFGGKSSTTKISHLVLLRVFNLCFVLPEATAPSFLESIRSPPDWNLKLSCTAKDASTCHLAKERPSYRKIKCNSFVHIKYFTNLRSFSQSFIFASLTLPQRILTVGEISWRDLLET